MKSLSIQDKIRLVQEGRVRYEVHYPSGRVEILSSKELHEDLKSEHPDLYPNVTYRPVYPED